MNIKVKVSEEQRKCIEDQLKRYKGGFIRIKEKAEKEELELKKRIADYKEFWATNEKPVFSIEFGRNDIYDENRFYETQSVWVMSGGISISSLDEIGYNGCKYCKKPIRRKYIAVGAHRDYDYDICDCEGAKLNGRPYKDLN